MKMNVPLEQTIVIQMQRVQTFLDHSHVLVIVDTKEMDKHVQISTDVVLIHVVQTQIVQMFQHLELVQPVPVKMDMKVIHLSDVLKLMDVLSSIIHVVQTLNVQMNLLLPVELFVHVWQVMRVILLQDVLKLMDVLSSTILVV